MHSHLDPAQSWSFPIWTTISLSLLVLIYLRGWLCLRHELPSALPALRLLSFVAGLALVWIATGSPLSLLHHRMLTAHMVQHLVIMAVAAPLILIAEPGVPFLYSLPKSLRDSAGVVLQKPGSRSLGRFLTHPVFCLLAPSAALIAWHMPAPFELAMRSAAWHDAQQA